VGRRAENNVVNARARPDDHCPTGRPFAVSVDANAAPTTRTDYDAVSAGDSGAPYSWAGRSYSSVTAFARATGQGGHDLQSRQAWDTVHVDEHSPLVDSADDTAPGMTATDRRGAARVDDPLVPDTGKGTVHADRGAIERQDGLDLQTSLTPASGVAPVPATAEVLSSPTSAWGQPLTFAVDFGDGTGTAPLTAGTPLPHVYATPGRYTATVTARTNGGLQRSTTQQVVAGTLTPPAATLSVVPPQPGSRVRPGSVDVTVTAAKQDAWQIRDYTIDWGDRSRDTSRETSAAHTYRRAGSYPVVLTATDALGRTSTSRVGVTVGDGYHPLAPAPVRAKVVRLRAHGTLTLPLKALQVNALSQAALVNVTVTGAGRAGRVRVLPSGAPAGRTSAVAFGANRPAAALVVAVTGPRGVTVTNDSAGVITLTLDVLGEFGTLARPALVYRPLTPTRLLDTRTGLGAPRAPLAGHRTLPLRVAGVRGVPAAISAVVLDVSTAGAREPGSLVVQADGTPRPGADSTTWAAGQPTAGLVVVPVKGGRVLLGNRSAGSVDVAATVVGYYTDRVPGSSFVPLTPQGRAGTRPGLTGTLLPGRTTTVRVAGVAGVPPAGVTGAYVTVTASGARGDGAVRVGSDGGAAAGALTYTAGAVSTRLLVVPVGRSGAVVLTNTGRTPVLVGVDVGGYLVDPRAS
jgi:PKD repeat protein